MGLVTPSGRIPKRPFPHPDVRIGYFYDAINKNVRFKCKISLIERRKDIKNKRKYIKYVPDFRLEYWSDPDFPCYWVLIKNICELSKAYKLKDFWRLETGKPIRNARNYVIIEDPNYPCL